MSVDDFKKSVACILGEARSGVDTYRLVDRLLVVLDCAVQMTLSATEKASGGQDAAGGHGKNGKNPAETGRVLSEMLLENNIYRRAL